MSDEPQLNLIFLANNVSGKFEEIEHDSHANVSFFDPLTTSWVSYSGRARVSRDKDLIHKYWSTLFVSPFHRRWVLGAHFDSLTDYIGDLEDGIHKGDADDPRISAIEVVPDEVRYWFTTKGVVVRTLQAAAGEAVGKVTLRGELRTISREEVSVSLATRFQYKRSTLDPIGTQRSHHIRSVHFEKFPSRSSSKVNVS